MNQNNSRMESIQQTNIYNIQLIYNITPTQIHNKYIALSLCLSISLPLKSFSISNSKQIWQFKKNNKNHKW